MKRMITGITLLAAAGAYMLFRPGSTIFADEEMPRAQTAGQTSAGNETTNPSSTGTVAMSQPTPTPTPTPMPTPTPAPKPVSTGQYVDGTYTGTSVDAFYGFVQVQATISGGKISRVTFLSYPNDRSTSRFINGQAMPVLSQEAITAQSAKVATVSGATETSGAFRTSLAAALAQAAS